MFFEEASKLVEYKPEKIVSETCRGVTLRGIVPTLRLISRMAPVNDGKIWQRKTNIMVCGIPLRMKQIIIWFYY